MKQWKKILALGLAAVMTMALLVACAPTKEEEPAATPAEETAEAEEPAEEPAEETAAAPDASDIHIAVNLKTLNSEYWGTVKAGCERAAEELGIQVTVNGPDAESEIQQQVTQIDDQLAQEIDAIIVAPCDGDAVAGALQNTIGTIPVLFVDSDVDLEGKTAFVGTSNVEAAATGGQYVGEEIGEDAKVVIIYGQEGEGTSNQRMEGYQKGLAEFGIEAIAETSGKNVTDQAKAAMEDLLTRFNNEIDAVLCHNDDTAIGALSACQDAGIADKVTIIGFDGNQSAVELIDSGDLTATIAQQPELMGYTAVMKAYDAIMGLDVDASVPVDTVLITKENASEFLK